jgi:hypothetical protein
VTWIGIKKIAFVPLLFPNAHPPDFIPPGWENDILRRLLYDPDPATGKDKSLRSFIHTVSSGVADLDAIVTERTSLAIRSITPNPEKPFVSTRDFNRFQGTPLSD